MKSLADSRKCFFITYERQADRLRGAACALSRTTGIHMRTYHLKVRCILAIGPCEFQHRPMKVEHEIEGADFLHASSQPWRRVLVQRLGVKISSGSSV